MVLGSEGTGGSASAAPKPSIEDPTSVDDADTRATEEMADSMLRDSPIPEIEEAHKQSEDVPTSKFVIPSPSISTFSSLFCFLLEEFFLGPLNQEDPVGKTGEMPRAEAALVVGTNTSVAPLESALPQVDRIKLA